MRILIDTNIRRRAITHVTRMVPQPIKWGNIEQMISVAQRSDYPPREDETFIKEQIPYLVILTTAAKEGKVEFYTSFELQMEEFRQRGIAGSEGYFGTDLFRDVPMKKLPCPIQRSIVIGAYTSYGITEEEQMSFIRSIQHPRFLQISKAVEEAHIDDAFHLWSAEEASLDVFLTLDKRFRNVVYNKRKIIGSPVLVMTPKELCEHLGLEPSNIENPALNPNDQKPT